MLRSQFPRYPFFVEVDCFRVARHSPAIAVCSRLPSDRSTMKFEGAWEVSLMECGTTTSNSRDILSSPWLAFAVWWLPGIAIVVLARSDFGDAGRTAFWRTVVWTAALTIMGIGCLINAARCGRVHCYITGPFFLVMAVVTLLYGLGTLSLGKNGRNLIGLTILVGAIALWWLPEVWLGKYRKSPATDNERR